jgi:hypothetical protein
MSSLEERMVIQTRMLVDEIAGQNRSDHEAIRAEVARNGASILKLVGQHTKKWAVGAAFVGFVGLALPVYSQIRTAYADDHVREVAAEKTRQEFERMKVERSVEIKQVAVETAREYNRLVTMPQEKITR